VALFTRTTKTATAVEETRSRRKKFQDARDTSKARSRTAEDRLTVVVEKLKSAEALGVESAAKGEPPASLSALEKEVRDAQNSAKAFASACSRAEESIIHADDDYRAAVVADVVASYAEIGGRLSESLRAASVIQAELLACYRDAPKELNLPVLAMPFLEPSGLVLWNSQLDAFIAPRPAPKLRPGLSLVRFIRSTPPTSRTSLNVAYKRGEVASFDASVAADLIASGFAEAYAEAAA
jgi:hypothetical protein